MMILALVILAKTFFFLRVFDSLSFLVSMLMQVFYDLRSFATFYILILVMFACMLSIIDWGNFEFNDDDVIRNIQYTSTGPDKEYLLINKFFARMVFILRISLGDLNFDGSTYLNPFENGCFMYITFLAIIVTNIIFMNFIIAEVSSSYQTVMDTLDVTLLRERGGLINESQDILRARFGDKRIETWKHLFPKYIIKRELDK